MFKPVENVVVLSHHDTVSKLLTLELLLIFNSTAELGSLASVKAVRH